MPSKAILFGIDYLTSTRPLRGCATDVHNMKTFVQHDLGYETVKVYTEQDTPDKVTAHSIIRLLHKLAVESWSHKLDRALIHFSGHGIGITDTSGDEVDGQDEAICPVDYKTSGVITDDLIKRLLRYFNPDTRVTCIFDCCHSGTIADLRYKLDGTTNVIESASHRCPSNVIMISGCRDDQTSADAYNVAGKKQYSGAMTSCLLECVQYRKKLSTDIDAATLLQDVRALLARKGFRQVPIITSSREITPDTTIF